MTSLSLRMILRQYHGIAVGEYSYGSLLNPDMCDQGTTIGRYVSIGQGTRRLGANHPIDRPTLHPFAYSSALMPSSETQDVKRSEIAIGHDVWIGADCLILPSVSRIGVGAVIGAGSVVTTDVPDFSVFVGNPARLMRYRFDEPVREYLAKDAPWLQEPTNYSSYRLSHEKCAQP